MDILKKPSLEDLTRSELIALIRETWGEPPTSPIAFIIWRRMTSAAERMRDGIVENQELIAYDRFLSMVDSLDEARKLDEQATSYFFRWVLGETETRAR